MPILVLEDKLGITEGYRPIWTALVMETGMNPAAFHHRSLWRDPYMRKLKLLTHKGNRKAPGFNPDADVLAALRNWTATQITSTKAEVIICMDPALFGIVEPNWDIATTDNLRGGVYEVNGRPFVIMTPISAVHAKKNPKDIRALNAGAESKEEFEMRVASMDDDELANEDFDEEFFLEPYTIPFGRVVLLFDLQKVRRLWEKVRTIEGGIK